MTNYGVHSIQHIKPLQHIRLRSGMYIPSTDIEGLHHLLHEVVDNSVDEFLQGHGKEIDIEVKDKKCIRVRDYGRGIPVGPHPDLQMDTLTAILTMTLTGGKFSDSVYGSSSGTFGVGIKVLTALCSSLRVRVFREKVYEQNFSKGEVLTEVIEVGENQTDKTGTEFEFIPDQEIFTVSEFDLELIRQKLSSIVSLLPGLKINLSTESGVEVFEESEVLSSIFDSIVSREFSNFELAWSYTFSDPEVQIRLGYYKTAKSQVCSFINTVPTYDGGSHQDAVVDSIVNALKRISGKPLTRSQVSSGLCLVVSSYFQHPTYRGQSKTKVSDSRVWKTVYNKIYQDLYSKLSSSKEFTNYLISLVKAQESAIEELSVIKAVEAVKSAAKDNILPAKLTPALNCSVEERELILVEGQSAGGGVKTARNPRFQEVLPLKGKIINAHKTSYSDLLNSKEVMDIFLSVGSMEKSNTPLRCKNVYILCDSDSDASHINALILGVFTVVFPSFIKNHNLSILKPPKFTLISGDIRMYGHDAKILREEFQKKHGKKLSHKIHYNKGLGEMQPEELIPVIDPKTRISDKCVWTEDTLQMMEKLMGPLSEVRRQILGELESTT